MMEVKGWTGLNLHKSNPSYDKVPCKIIKTVGKWQSVPPPLTGLFYDIFYL